tara:strand:- start:116 stop:289 length:174 start_codon:yes stop_codon:yes gene_type:complete
MGYSMKKSTNFILFASICGLPIVTDFATTEVNHEIFWVSFAAMAILFLIGLFYWKEE